MWVLLVPFVLPFLLIVAVVLFILKKWKWGVTSLFLCIVINYWTEAFPLNIFSTQETANGGIRVAAYNIDCLGSGNKHNGWEKELMSFIDETNPDVLFLAEFQYHNYSSYTHLLDSISKIQFIKTVVDVKYGRKDVIYSKYPISDFQVIKINPNFCESESQYKEITESYYQKLHPMIYKMMVDVNGNNVQVICCHLASNEFNVAKQEMGDKGLSGVLSNLKRGYVYREIEAKSIVEAIDKSLPTIVMGDLNDIGGSKVLSIFKKAGLHDAWWQKGTGYGHTYYKQGLYFRLDHILTSNHLKVTNVFVPKYRASDHYPIVADISPN